eukprot:SAG22_NODE_1901_length_3339_cov_3.176543_1_plen_29_part_10
MPGGAHGGRGAQTAGRAQQNEADLMLQIK